MLEFIGIMAIVLALVAVLWGLANRLGSGWRRRK